MAHIFQKGRIGITDHAQGELGDIVHIDLPFDGDKFSVEDAFGAVESVKTSAEVYSPADIEITEVNGELEETPQLVNEDPEGKGWIVGAKFENLEQLGKILRENNLFQKSSWMRQDTRSFWLTMIIKIKLINLKMNNHLGD